MAVDANKITALVDELSLPQAAKDFMITSLTDPANEASAQRFIAQRVRHDDYTRRTQELATERANIEQRVNTEVGRYATELQQAQDQIKRVMQDFENEHISRSTAEARLRKVKEVYQLSDEDIPAVEPPARTNQPPAAASGLTEDRVTALLNDFKKGLLTELGTEMKAFPRVAAVLDEISEQHLALTGKRLTIAEKNELMAEAQKENSGGLMSVWRQKNNIGQIEEDQRFEARLKSEKQKWDDDLKARTSADAMAGVRRYSDHNPASVSPVLGREYPKHTDEPGPAAVPATTPSREPAAVPTPSSPKPSGAERAAAKFLERRAQGIPMGERAPVVAGAGK